VVRKREKFRQKRESPRLRTSTILIIIIVAVGTFGLVLFSSGVVQFPSKSSSSGGALNSGALNALSTAIPANSLFEDYQEHPTLAAVNYTQEFLYVRGNVSAVENKGGLYRSCFDPSEPYFYGCSYADQMSG
jgi:hypothetical protein